MKFNKSTVFRSMLAGWFLGTGLLASGYSAIRFDAVGSPTEVIHTGRSEVLGSIALVVRGSGNVSGTAAGGAAQIGLIFGNPAVQIDNTTDSGIRIFSSAGFSATPTIINVENRYVGGNCAGFVTINIPAGSHPSDGDYIRIEGIRGRIDLSKALTAGTDLYADLQSINDPSANLFFPDRLRVAKSLPGMNVDVLSDTFYYAVRISEGFARAFVDLDSGNDGNTSNDRVDSSGMLLGAPTNSTQFVIRLTGIPSSISDVLWPAAAMDSNTGAQLVRIKQSYSNPDSTATYVFESPNQVDRSDLYAESFLISPTLIFSGGSCDTSRLAISVALSPSVAGSSSCSAPVNDGARPRFLEWFQSPLIISELIPSFAVVGGDAFILTVKGTGFVSGMTVLWNGSPRTTTFVDSSTLRASISAADITKLGNVTITVTNPNDPVAQLSSNPAIFTIAPPRLTLHVPRFVSTNSASLDETEYTGVAVANLSGLVATLKLLAFDRDGILIAGNGITNPAIFTLEPGQQISLLDSQVFGASFRNSNRLGWVRIEGNVPQMAGLALYMNGSKSSLESAGASSESAYGFVFPEIDWRSGQIQIANPGDIPAQVTLELVRANGTVKATSLKQTVAATGVLSAPVFDFFPNAAAQSTDYVRAVATSGVVSLEYLAAGAADARSLNGQDISRGASVLYASQFVSGIGDWDSTISVVNLSNSAGNLTFRFVGDDGTQLTKDLVLPIDAKGKLTVGSAAFGIGLNGAVQGYMEILGGGLNLTGSVAFTGSGNKKFASTAPLIGRLTSSMAFSQVASNADYFTGLAIVNPGVAPARLEIQVFDAFGKAVASRMFLIPARGRIAGLIGQIFPDLAGLNINSGYIRVSSVYALTGMALLGASDLSTLATVPLQPIQ